MTKTTQVFKMRVYTIAAFPNKLASYSDQTFTISTVNAGDMFLSVGPLDPNVFKDGDVVKVIVQRKGPRATPNLNQAGEERSDD